MPEIYYPPEEDGDDPVVVDLRDPRIAALLAWLVPGAGHIYQRRYAKGLLFAICVYSTFFFGLALGHGRVVYASFKSDDFRWQYVFQLGCGAVTFPAIAQAMKTKGGSEPYWVLCERFPAEYGIKDKRFRRITAQNNPEGWPTPEAIKKFGSQATLKDGFMAPPAGPTNQNDPDTLGRWQFDYKHFFDIGTVYTVVAGLLNFLIIYDAFCGPAILTPAQRERLESKKQKF